LTIGIAIDTSQSIFNVQDFEFRLFDCLQYKCSSFVISYKYSSLLEKQKYIQPKGLVVYANTMLEVKPLVIRTKTLVNILQPIVEKVCMISTVSTEVLAMVYFAYWSYYFFQFQFI